MIPYSHRVNIYVYVDKFRFQNTYKQGVLKERSLWGILRVNHAPSFMNYWHVTWDAYEPDQLTSPITKGKGKWRDEIRGYMIEYLRRNYLKEGAWMEYHVDPKYYMKS